jgi:quinol monooxygenase YgiN
MKKIQITAKFKIHPGKVEEFKKISHNAIAIVAEKEKGKTCLQYDWFFSPDETECVVRETYTDSNAVMTHLGNVGEILGQAISIADFSAELYGPLSDELKNATAPFDPKIYSFFHGL